VRIAPRGAPGFYTLSLLHVGCFAVFYAALWWQSLELFREPTRVLWWLKFALELLASFYFFSVVLKSCDYLLSPGGARDDASDGDRPKAPATPSAGAPGAPDRSWPPIACVYLSAGDLDPKALESLARLEHPGRYHVYVHDDSGDPRVGERVDATVEEIAARSGRPILVLRRRDRKGGKPGAVNYVLSRLNGRYPFILLADNDSTAVDPRTLAMTLPLVEDPRVAAVQFRNVRVPAPGEGPINRLLGRAIEVFDLFACHQARHGMPLFVGHNALLRAAALADAGGLREGIFADDIDLSIRLVRRGWTILYAPHIPFGETHPSSYAAFRRRAYKWAFGCGQILRRHLLPVLFDRRLSFSQKVGLLEFIGFYAIQAVLIAYLVLVGIVLPVVSGPPPGQAAALFLSGAAIVVSIFLPSFAYHARRGRLADWWPFALVCAVVYGSVAFASARGLLDGVSGRARAWVPTNLRTSALRLAPAVALESLFGLLLVLVPALLSPPVLWQPSMYLFATVFLCAPFVALLYVPARAPAGGGPVPPGGARGAARRFRAASATRVVIVLAAVLALALPFLAQACATAAPQRSEGVAVEGDRILVDGEPFPIRGVHYSPWLPGTGPMKDYPWPDEEVVDRDLSLIRDLGANTILVHDAPLSVLPAARRHGLRVIYLYFVNWQSVHDDALFEARAAEIERSAAALASEPNLLAVLLGNEVLEWVLRQKGEPFIEGRLRALFDRVKGVAPRLLVSHANWPIGRRLDLSYMDLVCFNLYPSWPREVVVAGYGGYIETVLKPIAAGRPLVISEFGQNSLEATEEKQAQVLRESWREIRARTAGGVVFSFADEWWKNYDNPIEEGEWWQRRYAPDDEKTRDLDPEEYYGIMTSERAPKPAYEAVREMFAARRASPIRQASLYALPLLALFAYTLYLFARGASRGSSLR
jgi:hypothetical protein